MKTKKLNNALKAFETKNLKEIIGGTTPWKVVGYWSPSPGVSYQDWADGSGTCKCDVPDGTSPWG